MHRDAQDCQGDRIRADPATQVVHGGQRCLGVALGVGGGDLQPRGLFQTVGGEQQVRGEFPELLSCPLAQPLLGEQRRHQVGGDPERPVALADGDGGACVIRREVAQQALTLRGSQPPHRCYIHGAHPTRGSGRGAGTRFDRVLIAA